jgi:hypothetical protein
MLDLTGRLRLREWLLTPAIDKRTFAVDELRNPLSEPTWGEAALTISGGSFNQNINGTKTSRC